MQFLRKQIIPILSALIILSPVCVKLIVGEWAVIPSSSMSPTLLPNDWLWYNKYTYGALLPERISEIPLLNLCCVIPSIRKYDEQTTWKSYRLKGFSVPRRMDITIFRSAEKREQLFVKRCIGMPGDTIVIRQGKIYINNLPIEEKGSRLPCKENVRTTFPSAMKNKWTSNEYGPLVIPYKGMKISLDTLNSLLYLETIGCENKDATNEKTYTFENNYYFMMGDNRGNSLDSRFLGFIPEKDIVGKATKILFSMGESDNFVDCFFKKLE